MMFTINGIIGRKADGTLSGKKSIDNNQKCPKAIKKNNGLKIV